MIKWIVGALVLVGALVAFVAFSPTICESTGHEIPCGIAGALQKFPALGTEKPTVENDADADDNLTNDGGKTDETSKEESAVNEPVSYDVFYPGKSWEWEKLGEKAPTGEEFLKAHGLMESQTQMFVYPDDKDKDTKPTWEPAMFVIELAEDQYGKVILKLLEGYTYTVALCDGTVQTLWGGDPAVKSVCVQWGFTARWAKTYASIKAAQWLDINSPAEWVTRENRFGRYRRSEESGLPNLPYFDRWGPYNTLAGNVLDWNPPSLDAVNASTYLEATAMFGGLAREDEWSRTDDGGWAWLYGEKVAGSGTYCKDGEPCWQTVYVPPASRGCAILWMEAPKEISGGQRATNGGPYPFYAGDLAVLLDGDHQVDEFSYHPVTCPLP